VPLQCPLLQGILHSAQPAENGDEPHEGASLTVAAACIVWQLLAHPRSRGICRTPWSSWLLPLAHTLLAWTRCWNHTASCQFASACRFHPGRNTSQIVQDPAPEPQVHMHAEALTPASPS